MPAPLSFLPKVRISVFAVLCSTFIILTCLQVHAASFDCGKAAIAVEQMICADAVVSDLDSQLGQGYSDLIAMLTASAADTLHSEQKQWLTQRNLCQDHDCLVKQYRQRVGELKQLMLENQYAGQDMVVSSVSEQTYDNAASIIVRFSVPVESSQNFRRYLKIYQDETLLGQDHWILSEDGLLAIYPFVEPLTKYKVKVKPGIRAVNQETQIANRSFELKTRRTVPSAGFTGSGFLMSASLKRALPVTTLNVDEVELDIFKIEPLEIPRWSSYTSSERRNYYQLNNFSAANPLVHTGRFAIEHKRNQRTTTNLDLSDINALDQEGAYLAVMRIPGQYEYQYDTNFFTVSDLGLQVRKNADSLHVISHSVVSGKAQEAVEISLYGKKELLAQQLTDKNGIATFGDSSHGVATVIARKGQQSTVVRLNRPLDLAAIRNAVTKHQESQIFAWGPRDLYRPGEKLEVYALLRDYDGRSLTELPVSVELIDAAGSSAVKVVLNPEKNGAYQFHYALPDNAKTGRWKLLYRLSGVKTVIHEYHFSIEDFMPERMKLTVFDGDYSKRRLRADPERLEIPLTGAYLYGAPASGNKVDGFITAELDRHPFPQWDSYAFGIADEEVRRQRQQLNDLHLDDEGNGSWIVKMAPWHSIRSPLALTTTASLYESGGRPVTRSISVTRTNQTELIGIEPQFKDRADNNSRPEFKLILTDSSGNLRSAENYQANLIREDRNYYWTYSDGSGWVWNYDPMEYQTFSRQVSFDGSSSSSISVPVEWGNYRLEIRDQNNGLLSSYRFRTGWYWWGNAEGTTALKPDQVRMTFEDDVYHQGEIARLLMTPPTDGLATITVENNDEILWVGQEQVFSKGSRIDIPINKNWYRHDIYVTATVLTPGDMKHSVAPKRAFGFINLPLKRVDAELEVALEVPTKTEPGQQISARVKVSAQDKLPENVYVTLAAVDVGVLNITRFATPDPAAYLYAPRRLSTNYYDVYGRIIENAGFNYVQQRFGGGFRASGAELARGGNQPKNDVAIMSWQSQPVKIQTDGSAVISMALPDFNGKLRWMAVAYADQAYGHAEAETTVADKLVVQLAKPRFMALGDQAEISLDLSNQSGSDLQIELQLMTSGGLKATSQTETLSLVDKKKTTLQFPLSVQTLETGVVTMKVQSSAGSDNEMTLEKSWSVGIRSAYPAVTRKTQKAIKSAESWQPEIQMEDLNSSSVAAQLILSPQPPIDINSHFKELLNYPYGCTEQSTSSGYPWVLVDSASAGQLGLLPVIERKFKRNYNEQFRKTQIKNAVARLLQSQNTQGGFGAWSNRSDEMNWLTAYVADFLTDARLAGAEVPAAALEKTVQRLQTYLRDQGQIHHRWIEDVNYYSFATKAYTAYVLAKINRLSLSDLRRYYDGLEQIESRSPLPWIQLGYAFDLLGDGKRAESAYQRGEKTAYNAGYDGTYGSQLRDLSLVYVIKAKRGTADGELLLSLFQLTKERRWLSTQERNALFKAAVAADSLNEGKLDALITTAEFSQTVAQEKPFKTLLDSTQLKEIQQIKAGESTVYASLELNGQYAEPPVSYANGLSIVRDYFDMDGQARELDMLNSGELIVIRLQVSADQYTPDALVVDLLPAGLELENQNLGHTSVDLSQVTIDGESLSSWRKEANAQHVEYRDDRFVAALSLDQTDRNYHLYYLARAVTPGQYQVPPPYIEDMYRPYLQALGSSPAAVTINR